MYYLYHIRRKSNHDLAEGYIGISSDYKSRWRQHKYHLTHKTHSNKHLQNAWELYNDIEFELISTYTSLEEALDNESFLRPVPDVGWNIKSGGTDFVVQSSESIAKRVATMTGRKQSEETKRRISATKKGKPSNRRGVKLSDKTKNKMKIASTGRKHSQASLDKMMQHRLKYVEPHLWLNIDGRMFYGNPKQLRDTYKGKIAIGTLVKVVRGEYKSHKGWTILN